MNRKYPNNISKNGTTIKQGFINDDADIRNLYQLLDTKASKDDLKGYTPSKGNTPSPAPTPTPAPSEQSSSKAAPTGVYNIVLDCHYNANGEPDFLTYQSGSRYVGINGEDTTGDGSGAKPVVINFADGFAHGRVTNYTETIATNNINVWCPGLNTTQYLYVERQADGKLSYGTSAYPCITSYGYPTNAQQDQHIYNPNTAHTYYYDGGSWRKCVRVFLGVAVTDKTGIISVSALPTASASTTRNVMVLEKDGRTVDLLNPKDTGRKADVVAASLTASTIKADTITGSVRGDVTGNADTANKLTKPFNLTVGGDITDDIVKTKVAIDGSDDVQLSLSVRHAYAADVATNATKAGRATEADQATHCMQAYGIQTFKKMPESLSEIQGNIFIVWPEAI